MDAKTFQGLWILLLAITLSGCETNLYSSLVGDGDERARKEQARIYLDEQNYDEALEILEAIETDSNEVRLLRVSARLGVSGLSMWSILKNIIDSSDFEEQEGSGVDNFFDRLSANVVGDVTERSARIEALTASIEDLLESPDPSANRVRNLACFLSGILVLPTVADAQSAIDGTRNSLTALAATVGTSNPEASCPDLGELNTSLAAISRVRNNFSLIFQATQGCKILDITGNAANLNAIERQLIKFDQQADQGCNATPSCGSSTACQALGLGCVFRALTADGRSVSANDGTVSSCELVQNCLNPADCF